MPNPRLPTKMNTREKLYPTAAYLNMSRHYRFIVSMSNHPLGIFSDMQGNTDDYRLYAEWFGQERVDNSEKFACRKGKFVFLKTNTWECITEVQATYYVYKY